MRAFAWFLALMTLALAAIAVFSYPAWTLLHPYFDFPFHRVGERIGMLALLVGFLPGARHRRLAGRGGRGCGGVGGVGGRWGWGADAGGIGDAFLGLLAGGGVLGMVRAATGNIAACIGLHAGWVWVMLVTHELTRPARGAPLGFLLSRFDGFVGWLVLAWTAVLAGAVWRS